LFSKSGKKRECLTSLYEAGKKERKKGTRIYSKKKKRPSSSSEKKKGKKKRRGRRNHEQGRKVRLGEKGVVPFSRKKPLNSGERTNIDVKIPGKKGRMFMTGGN